ncbi:Glyoxalase/bleomycin resistance protein/dioxygenase [Oleidesulfovibrio alaskensis G20]|jgi:catechol 2,3-dioxygenase-like lactoylglutathione lyase family enzyme|uniref:Glyoxalase/bleomycin resistance protein/dioxygenase n=1 Tax=Oleidesulfovibrio alaskensis (strain ATCC BAA-1058 / DSM 17464 / G20) TaxID=207559 RepID=Q30WR9_OLEA2|nr:VOC family protein [Oleidesulfovibrio alaskensis]ABB39877.1 Glyoxalase/bleomycin resistance protein/dioxygenase [Oleidesulfovibrio alaskensis G20]MBG0773594.1 VOC family protein [Oleidesulfovibrio alaskensis]MBL3582085.1 VOC family protein [Oleidesulfovibrio alaskensis]
MTHRKFEQRLNLVTIGVADLDRSRQFYRALGWTEVESPDAEHIAFFDMGGTWLALFPAGNLLEDIGMKGASPAPGGMTLAQNVRSEAEVEALLSTAEHAGARILSPAVHKPWGYSGYFADPDGTPWEVAYVPALPLDEKGMIRW